MLEVAFNPLTRVDTRRAYNLGVLTDEQVLQSYRDSGYSDENADTLLRFSRKERSKAWKTRPAVKAAIAGQSSIGEALADANKDNIGQEGQETIRQIILQQIEWNRRKACLANIKKRYLRGEFDDQQLNNYLNDLPIELDTVGLIAEGWKCEKATKSKTLAAAQLCKLYSQKIITIIEFQDRLHNMGYSADDALKLLSSCVQGLELADKRKLEQIGKQKASLDEKLRKLALKEMKDQDKLAAAIAKRLSALHKARERRSSAIVSEAEALAKKTGESMVVTLQACKGLVNRLRSERGFSEDDAIAQLQVAVSAAASAQRADLWQLATLDPLPLHDTV
jgi:DNA-binding transcriptional MerR regulator